jgi:hypothetical protein
VGPALQDAILAPAIEWSVSAGTNDEANRRVRPLSAWPRPRASTGRSLIRCSSAPRSESCTGAVGSSGAWTDPASRSNQGTRCVKRRPPSPDRTDTAAMLFSGRAQATPHHERLVARGTSGASAMGEPPIGRNVFPAGSRSSASRRHDRRALATERSPRSRARSQTCGSRTQRR